MAARGGFADVAHLMLLRKDADLDLRNKDGRTAAEVAIANNQWHIAKLLFQSKV